MKALTCEMCGSTDLIKQDGVFVCQSCGTKYSVEEAKRMMVEGTVDVKGTVKIDNTSEMKSLFESARRAKESNLYDAALNTYQQILMKDSTSWEAFYYVAYLTAVNCTNGEILSSATTINKSLKPTYSLIKDYIESEEEQSRAVSEVTSATVSICRLLASGFDSYMSRRISRADGILESSAIALEKTNGLNSIAKVLMDNSEILQSTFGDRFKHQMAESWKGSLSFNNTFKDELIPKIKEIEPDYEYKKPGGCYVATAVYGSYDCPEVWTLRRFRDFSLAETWYGRAFIRTYYAISPTLVKWFGNTYWFKKMWRGALDQMVKNLKNQGFESTPYEDRVW